VFNALLLRRVLITKYGNRKAGLSKGDVHTTGAVLTKTISDFSSRWDLKELGKAFSRMDFMWSSIGDEHRQKILLGEAFSASWATPQIFKPTDSFMNGVAESVLKVSLRQYLSARTQLKAEHR
jgi:hypothetical protein